MDIPLSFWILGLGIIFIMLFMVIGVEHTIPMFVRAEFDDICNNYLAVIERDGGLSSIQRDALEAELGNIGISNVNINAPVNGNWGEKVTLRIEGDYDFQSTKVSDLSKKSISKKMTYENSTVILCND